MVGQDGGESTAAGVYACQLQQDIAAFLLLEGGLNIEKRHDDEREGWHMEDTYG